MEEKKLTAKEDKASSTKKYKRYIFGKAGDDCNGAIYISRESAELSQVTLLLVKED